MFTSFYDYFEKTEHPDLETVKRMKLRGCDDWDVAFEKVCKTGCIKMYKYFIDNGANCWDSGLQGACEGGHMELVELLMVKPCTYYYGGFIGACRGGNVDIIKLLYDKNPDVKKSDFSVMYEGCKSGKMDAVTFLLELGFDNINGGLCGAANGGYLDIIKLMIDVYATYFNRALYEAASGGNLEIVKYLLSLGVDIQQNLLPSACCSGDIELVIFCLELGNYDVNQGLINAYYSGHLEIVKWMIKLGADANLLDPWEYVNLASSEVTRYLLQLYPSLFTNFKFFEYMAELDFYNIYLQRGGVINLHKYKRLVSCQHPLYCVVINYYQQENKLIRMLPVDVWKLMMPFLA